MQPINKRLHLHRSTIRIRLSKKAPIYANLHRNCNLEREFFSQILKFSLITLLLSNFCKEKINKPFVYIISPNQLFLKRRERNKKSVGVNEIARCCTNSVNHLSLSLLDLCSTSALRNLSKSLSLLKIGIERELFQISNQ